MLELESPEARERITQAAAEALLRDDSDVFVLGCAGMADLAPHLSVELGVPVVDGLAAATVTVQGLVGLGLQTRTREEFAAPPPKEYHGLLRGFGADTARI